MLRGQLVQKNLLFPIPQENNQLEQTISCEKNPRLLDDILELTLLRSEIKKLNQQKEELENVIKDHIGDFEEVSYKGRTILSNKIITQDRLDIPSFRNAFPNLYSQLVKKISFKRLLITNNFSIVG